MSIVLQYDMTVHFFFSFNGGKKLCSIRSQFLRLIAFIYARRSNLEILSSARDKHDIFGLEEKITCEKGLISGSSSSFFYRLCVCVCMRARASVRV